ncbi:MAG: lysozyme [Alphaproteobacteria bacterium]|nr:lysozyme [Alphaproteobacteria bacterium]
MSEPAAPVRRKVSREGVVLLKSFEGFRARAERDAGGWVIGYGHRTSAREGLTVGEADAELLLQYDLLPVVSALNALPVALNAHQFDAVASFAFSVGVERFLASDVHARLAEGRPEAAAEALLAWTEPSPAVAGLRRRAAERALFLADPERPVALAELLSAPLPAANPVPAPVVEARAAAVAALLGEDEGEGEGDDSAAPPSTLLPPPPPLVVPAFGPAEATPVPDADPVPADDGPALSEPERELELEPQPEPEPETETETETERGTEPAAEAPAPVTPPQWGARYGVPVVGPLPGFGMPAPSPVPPASLTPSPLPPVEVPADAPAAAEAPAPAAQTWPQPVQSPFPAPVVEPLVLTPPPEVEAAPARPAWGEEERPVASPAQDPLFVDAPSQVSILRHEEDPATPPRFDWSETGMYVIMGGLGLVSCAVSAAAFRVAVEDPSPMGETTAVAWTLAVIGAVCVGAASWHLWVRTTRRKA